MKQKHVLTEQEVEKIMAASVAEAKKNKLNVAVAVTDDGGHLLALKRLDNTPPIASHIAPDKARTASLGQRSSKVYEDMINDGRTAFVTASSLQSSLAGGEPILVDGMCIGAVGVSGVKPHEDVQVALAGVAVLTG